MEHVPVRIRLEGGAAPPFYASAHAAGADICAGIQNPVELQPGERTLIPTGMCIELPEGYEAQIRPRSGLAVRNGITVLNTPGTIDADYRGEIQIILINHGTESWTVHPGERIAQMVIQPVVRADFKVAEEISRTARGAGGFGSTGS